MPSADELLPGYSPITLDTLTAAGVTESGLGYSASALTYQVTITGIGTNVVLRFEGSLDGTNYFNLDQTNVDTTITANGTYGFCLNGCPINYARLRVVSVSGGTPSIAAKLRGI